MINRNDCNFDVNNYPFLDGNISKGQSYSIFISQLVRLARINSSFNSFILDCKVLVRKLARQSFSGLLATGLRAPAVLKTARPWI